MTPKAELLRMAVGQPAVIDGDHVGSARAHAELIRSARTDVMVFPELSLTGYQLDAADVDLDGDAVALLVEACRSTDACALVGAPVTENGERFIAILRVDGNGAEIAYRKTHLHGDENNWFVSGRGASAIEVLGWRIGLGICKDTGTAEHIHATAALDIDVYACGVVHHRWELAEQQRRAAHISATCGAYVAMASFAGATGEGFRATAGCSVIVSPGQRLLAAAGSLPGDYATAVLV
ncbi:carbon-nitrogen hydrolase family protein [Rhodococcus sp. (in: high G+C Gram-positive bacteria)]|uniref:carbon-nitrogen hydrolase family protein n=1 Tax=Rhodococcus sp. TaxID=1831 RepID=UPI00388FD36A